MKKILIIAILILMVISVYSENNEMSKEYRIWNNLYWSMYFSTIGYAVTYSSALYIANMALDSADNSLTSQDILYSTLFYGLQLCLFDALNAIPTIGPFITSGSYLAFGILEMAFYAILYSNPDFFTPAMDPGFTLRSGIAFLINFILLLPSGIIQTVSKYNMKRLKDPKVSNFKIHLNYDFLNKKNDIQFAVSFNI